MLTGRIGLFLKASVLSVRSNLNNICEFGFHDFTVSDAAHGGARRWRKG